MAESFLHLGQRGKDKTILNKEKKGAKKTCNWSVQLSSPESPCQEPEQRPLDEQSRAACCLPLAQFLPGNSDTCRSFSTPGHGGLAGPVHVLRPSPLLPSSPPTFVRAGRILLLLLVASPPAPAVAPAPQVAAPAHYSTGQVQSGGGGAACYASRVCGARTLQLAASGRCFRTVRWFFFRSAWL